MNTQRFQHLVTSTEELATLMGPPSELVIRKQLSELDAHMRSFIENAPFALLGTVGGDGRCDVSPRGDRPAVAKVLDSKTLVIADRRGNRRADSMKNIIETGRAALLFLVPGSGETLRINGWACITLDKEILTELTVDGKEPLLGIGIEVEECYFQCAKALMRSQLWEHDAEARSHQSRRFAEILIEQTKLNQSVDTLAEQIEESYRDRLY